MNIFSFLFPWSSFSKKRVSTFVANNHTGQLSEEKNKEESFFENPESFSTVENNSKGSAIYYLPVHLM
jgi:hypothetical protein